MHQLINRMQRLFPKAHLTCWTAPKRVAPIAPTDTPHPLVNMQHTQTVMLVGCLRTHYRVVAYLALTHVAALVVAMDVEGKEEEEREDRHSNAQDEPQILDGGSMIAVHESPNSP